MKWISNLKNKMVSRKEENEANRLKKLEDDIAKKEIRLQKTYTLAKKQAQLDQLNKKIKTLTPRSSNPIMAGFENFARNSAKGKTLGNPFDFADKVTSYDMMKNTPKMRKPKGYKPLF